MITQLIATMREVAVEEQEKGETTCEIEISTYLALLDAWEDRETLRFHQWRNQHRPPLPDDEETRERFDIQRMMQ